MTAKAVMSRGDRLVLMEELAIFKFDKELAAEEIRKPKSPKNVIARCRVRYSRRPAKDTLQ
jgi:hypothetical protein